MVEFSTQEGPAITGDKPSDTTTFMLKKLVHEDQFNAFCIDCQKNRSTHANVTFGVFICQDCALFHQANFPMYECYIKNVFDECWDTFQLQNVNNGGNKRFYEFMKGYEKEREPILKKYTASAALYYRKKLCCTTMKQQFNDEAPPRNAQEAAERAGKAVTKTAAQVGTFLSDANQKYRVEEKASAAASATKNAFVGLFNKAKDAIATQPAGGQPNTTA